MEAILIAGPTASGKSALALRLAGRLGGTVINADSMQVYRDLRVLTARPSPADEARAPHRLYGTVDGGEVYSVSRWLSDVAETLAAVRTEGRMPIIVGGTGLYFKALTQGLSAIPPVPDAVRAEVRAWAAERAPVELHALLAASDPVTASRLRPTDPQRIVRALEVHRATGRGLASFHETRDPALVDGDRCVAIVLAPDRGMLRARIDARFEAMMASGALAEVEALAGRMLQPDVPILRTLGVPPLMRHLRGELSAEAAIERAKLDSRQYLKRQQTFARHQLQHFRPVEPDQAEAFVLDQLA